ncbi:DUF1990 family protein [Streptomyces sp. RPT161]|uniref:DUF1990 family protein n=1 Tax=Streptomyces sp. RPT161 TaxID=3015993 RepID=UPI0022B9021D|nr:DUF1990 domain-containing protein [Streptomyces sp. RPT161]
MGGFTYDEVGAVGRIEELPPPGYHLFRVRTRIGDGPSVLSAAGEAVLGWRMHRAMGVRMDATAERAAPGVRVVVGLGIGRCRIHAPCEVVWTVREPHRIGFAYGTLPGHPERGEESFVVEREADGAVWLSVTAFSRAASWYMRAAGPLGRALQRAYARWCGVTLRRLTRADMTRSAASGASLAPASPGYRVDGSKGDN